MRLILSCFLVVFVHHGVAEVVEMSGNCGNITDSQYYKFGISDQDKALILKLHNDVRQQVAEGHKKVMNGSLPPACCMRKMQWDDGLAEKALIHAMGCLYDYWNPGCDCGQNIHKLISSKKSNVDSPDWKEAAYAWNNMEAVNFLKTDRRPFVIRDNAQSFSQMAWQDSNKLGCAAVWFMNVTVRHYPWQTLYTCQYSKPGNKECGVMYYAVGEPECGRCLCSQCAKNMDPEYPNLCNAPAK